jgi:hypothetical protein
MSAQDKKIDKENLRRLNTRIWGDQEEYAKAKVKKSKTKANPKGLTEGEVYRDLLAKGIKADKQN